MRMSEMSIFDLLTALPAHPPEDQRPTEATQTDQRRAPRPNPDALAGCRSPQVIWTVCDARGPAGVSCGGHAGTVPDARPWHALEALLGACQGSPLLERSPKSRLWSQDGEESGSQTQFAA